MGLLVQLLIARLGWLATEKNLAELYHNEYPDWVWRAPRSWPRFAWSLPTSRRSSGLGSAISIKILSHELLSSLHWTGKLWSPLLVLFRCTSRKSYMRRQKNG